MTEKRFECYDLIFDGFIKDTLTNENIVEPIKLIHLLNELFEEREYFERKKEYFLSKWSIAHAENIQLRQENKELKKENEQLKQKIQRWKNLYEIKDAEVTARVDSLNKVCEYYTSEVLFKSDVDPNKAVKEVLTEILNTEVEMW